MTKAPTYLDWEDADGKQGRFELVGAQALIGGSESADVSLTDPRVADFHVRLERRAEGGWSLLDLGTRTGTYVNGERVSIAGVHVGDRIRVGDSRLMLQCPLGPALSERLELEVGPRETERIVVEPREALAGRPLTAPLLDRLDTAAARLMHAPSREALAQALAADWFRTLQPARMGVGKDVEQTCEWMVVLDQAGAQVADADLPARLVPPLEAMPDGGVYTWEAVRRARSASQEDRKGAGCALVFPIKGLGGRPLGRIYAEGHGAKWGLPEAEMTYLALLVQQAGLVWENLELQKARQFAGLFHRELSAARELQLLLLPKNADLHPRLDVAARNVPALSVSGDYYDFMPLGGQRIAAILADAMGHGLSAALLMSRVQTCFQFGAESQWDIREFDRQIRRVVARHAEAGFFVTGLLLLFDMAADVLELLCAGHPWPSILCRDEGVPRAEEACVEPWGFPSESGVKPLRLPLSRGGCSVAAFTDGVSDALSGSGGGDSLGRIAEMHREHQSGPASEICDAILTRSLRRADYQTGLPDDLTVLVLKSRPSA